MMLSEGVLWRRGDYGDEAGPIIGLIHSDNVCLESLIHFQNKIQDLALVKYLVAIQISSVILFAYN